MFRSGRKTVWRVGIVVVVVLPLLGQARCPRLGGDLNPGLLSATGFCTTYLKGNQPLPHKVGEIKVTNGHAVENAAYDLIVPMGALDRYDFRIGGGSINNNFSDAGSGNVRFGGASNGNTTVSIEVFLKEDIMAGVEENIAIEFFAPGFSGDTDQLVRRVESRLKVAVRTEEKVGDARVVPRTLIDEQFATAFVGNLMGLPVGVDVAGSAEEQGTQKPENEVQIFAGGVSFAEYSGWKAFEPFPCGAGDNGLTVCPAPASDLDEPDGVEYSFLVSLVDADVPLNHPTNFYTYSFVFDTDALPFNDWVPSPSFPNDFFQGTDRWYEIAYEPGAGWELIASQVTNGAAQQVTRGVPTAANAIIVGNAITLVVPTDELSGTAKGIPSGFGVRYTSFRHTGDFGLNPPFDYNADVEPPVDEGLFRFE